MTRNSLNAAIRPLDDPELFDLVRVVAVMGQAVVVLVDAFDRRLEVHAADEDGDHAGGIGLHAPAG